MKNKLTKEQENNKSIIDSGIVLLKEHPLFKNVQLPPIIFGSRKELGRDGAGCVSVNTHKNRYAFEGIMLNADMKLKMDEWAFVIAHLYLHLAFGHFDAEKMPGYNSTEKNAPRIYEQTWNLACDIFIDKFLREVKAGRAIGEDPVQYFTPGVMGDEQRIYRYLITNNISIGSESFGMAGKQMDMEGLSSPIVYDKSQRQYWSKSYNHYSRDFARALAYSLNESISIAGGHGAISDEKDTSVTRAVSWFLGHYPLLGGLAASFRIEQNPEICRQNDISIAAVDIENGIIYTNTARGFSDEEWKFILAHEYLHAGLQHNARQDDRDAFFWNIACDYVINGWLNEMHIGTMPSEGLMYDESLKGESAEDIYDMIMDNMRRFSKSLTFRGYGKGDIIGNSTSLTDGTNLDEFCRNALLQGLEYHIENNRGYIPAGLVEEIRALVMPPIRWDVKLANWFDKYVMPVEKHRSYACPSRRQGSTLDIPRPRYVLSEEKVNACTFGVIIDTSGSMSTKDIGKALGSVASYSISKGVPAVRVVFCDADAYDAGYMTPEEIAGRVEVTGRGGTVLQPAVNLLEKLEDFPKDGPILLITDGYVERLLTIKRTHAFLIPKGNRLPFKTKGEVFYYD